MFCPLHARPSLRLLERLEALSGVRWPHIMTFHALAWALVQPEEELLFNSSHCQRLAEVVSPQLVLILQA